MRTNPAVSWFSAFLIFVFLAAGYKDDVETIATHQWFSELSWPPMVRTLKANWYIALSAAVGCSTIWILARPRMVIYPNLGAALAVLLAFIAMCRGLLQSGELGLKLAAAFLFVCGLVLIFLLAGRRFGRFMYPEQLAVALYVFAFCHVGINAALLFAGHGYVPGNPRFFGTSVHPNFIAVQLGLCSVILFSRIRSLRDVTTIVALAAALGMQVLSGSRTGLLLLIVGLLTYICARQRFRSTVIVGATFFLAVIVAFIVMFVPGHFLMAFDRGTAGIDTRTTAWTALWSAIEAAPLLGHGGDFSQASENSYLRGWAKYGIFYFVVLILLVGVSTRNWIKVVRSVGYTSAQSMLLALHVGLVIGGLFEGYLVDSFSLPAILFLLTSVFGRPPLVSSADAMFGATGHNKLVSRNGAGQF
jgi:O-antigen ligase